jgi:ABC-type polysaccharide/polyol phosphate transport system ATPase subunit
MTLSRVGPEESVDYPVGEELAPDAPVVIEVRDVHKAFRIPTQKVTSLKERALHPLRTQDYRLLQALRDISFDIRKGEFFGIVGRNGSGKSTLLKALASIYSVDGGSIRMAGRVAPFIELGVGFNPELTARENVVLNGVMMGLSQAEARSRLGAVLEFAELEEFVDLKLKNYSSGMLVRLAFSVMIQSDAEILLIDEVLAVGDAAFQQKCADVFHQMRDSGRTIVLVTHDMGSVQAYCHRAMLIHDGEMIHLGDPEEVARRYFRLNFADEATHPDFDPGAIPDVHARLVDAHLEDENGASVDNVAVGEPIRLRVTVEARDELLEPVFGFHFNNADGIHVFGFNKGLDEVEGVADRLLPGEQAEIFARIENPLMPGRYVVSCWVCRNRNAGDVALQVMQLLDFVVYGQRPGPGVVTVDADVAARRQNGKQS